MKRYNYSLPNKHPNLDILYLIKNEYEPIHVHGKYQAFESKADFIIVDGKIIDIKIKDVKGKINYV